VVFQFLFCGVLVVARVNGPLGRLPFVWLVGDRGVERVEGFVALERAREDGLDLVEVGEREKVPVCKIEDFGKVKFEASKRAKAPKGPKLKEVRLTPKIGEADFLVRVNQAKVFLGRGDKVQVSVVFRGREMVHVDEGQKVMDRFVVESGGVVESRGGLMGKRLVVVLGGK
jgi:translation initiation factor IF-3